MNSSTTSLYSKMTSDAKLVIFKNKKVLCWACNKEKSVISKEYRDMCQQCFNKIKASVKEYEDEVKKTHGEFSSLWESLRSELEKQQYSEYYAKKLVSIDRDYTEDLCDCEFTDSDSDYEKECYCYDEESSQVDIYLELSDDYPNCEFTIELTARYNSEGYSYRKILVSIEQPKSCEIYNWRPTYFTDLRRR